MDCANLQTIDHKVFYTAPIEGRNTNHQFLLLQCCTPILHTSLSGHHYSSPGSLWNVTPQLRTPTKTGQEPATTHTVFILPSAGPHP